MSDQKELYGVTFEDVYFVGVGKSGFRKEDENCEKLILQNVIFERLSDPYGGTNDRRIYVRTELNSRKLWDDKKRKRISSITFKRKDIDIDNLVVFLLENEPVPNK